MKKRVAVLDIGYDSYDQEEDILGTAGYELTFFRGEREDREGRIRLAAEAEGVFLRYTVVDDDFLDALPNLKAIVRYGVGYDNINVDACTRHGVKVRNVRGYANHAVSDHALALMFACARNLKEGMAAWGRPFGCPPRSETLDFHDRTLGIVGLGNIGGTLCRKAQNLFGRVIASDPYVGPSRFAELGVARVDLPTLLAGADAVSLHCNLTEESRFMINAGAIAAMTRKPILVNTARGEVLDPAALADAVRRELIHSAGIDVFPEEPPGANWNEILEHPHVIATGHYAWHSVSAARELQRLGAQNLGTMLQGGTPPDCLNPEMPE